MQKVDLGYPLFQSHAGSIEAVVPATCHPRPSWFQSHAGSIEASTEPACAREGPSVSIPRWFD